MNDIYNIYMEKNETNKNNHLMGCVTDGGPDYGTKTIVNFYYWGLLW